MKSSEDTSGIAKLIQLHWSLLEEVRARVQDAKTRGVRLPGDPLEKSEKGTVAELEAFETELREYLKSCVLRLPPDADRAEIRRLRAEIDDLPLDSGFARSKLPTKNRFTGRPQYDLRIEWRTVYRDVERLGPFLVEMQELSSAGSRVGQRIPWLGTDREWGDRIIEMFNDKLIQARSKTDALMKAAPHFVNKRGKQFNPRSILQSLKTRSDFEGKSS